MNQNSNSNFANNHNQPQYPGSSQHDQFYQNPPTLPSSNPYRQIDRQLTEREMTILGECMGECFWTRCVPLCIGASFAVAGGFKYGIFASPKQFVPLYYAAAIGTAFVAGKFSYFGTCVRRLTSLKEGSFSDGLRYPEQAKDSFFGSSTSELQRDDMHYRPHEDTNIYHSPEFLTPAASPPAPKDGQTQAAPDRPVTSYDDLRRRNREEYQRRQATMYPSAPNSHSQQYADPHAQRQGAYPPPQQSGPYSHGSGGSSPYHPPNNNQAYRSQQSYAGQSPTDRTSPHGSGPQSSDSQTEKKWQPSGKYKDEGFY